MPLKLPPEAPRRDVRKRVRIAAYLVVLVSLFLIVDTAMYFTFSWLNTKRNLFYDSRTVTEEQLRSFLDMSFDPALGWNVARVDRSNLGTRRPQDYPVKATYKLKAFGDSFTYGAEVGPADSFCAAFERTTDWDCLNYGVNGYGPDQALLRYASIPVRSEYTMLGILSENIGRVVSHYPPFYMRWWAPPKPRFINQKGHFTLLEAPIRSESEATKLLDSRYIDSLKAFDYWPTYYEQVQHAPARLEWPATWMVLKHADFFWARIAIEVKRRVMPSYEVEKETYKYYHLYDSNTEALGILEHVIDEFVRTARQRGEIPLIVVFSDQFSLDLMKKYGTNPYAPLVDFLKQRAYAHVDMGSIFLNEPYGDYFLYHNGHFSPRGNARVAQALAEFIGRAAENSPDQRPSSDQKASPMQRRLTVPRSE